MRLLTILICALMLSACVSDNSIYVTGDRATYDVVADEYLELVDSHDDFDAEQKGRRHRLVETWRMRIEEAEKGGSRE